MSLSTAIDTKFSLKKVFSDYKQLAKVGLSLSVVFSSIAGYLLAIDVINYQVLFLLGLGGFLMVAASNAFNQIIEKDTDALMKRTMNRPLPTGRMSKTTALVFAILFAIVGLGILYSINPKSALFGLILYKIPSPTIANNMAKTNAVVLDILPVGRGLFIVLFIKASVSFSII